MNVVRLRSMWRADGDRGPLVLRYEAKNASLLQVRARFPATKPFAISGYRRRSGRITIASVVNLEGEQWET